jgi:Ca2+-binding EF-hand superfamily protein
MMTQLGIQFTKKDLDSMFHQLDADGSGTITFSEFLNGLKYLDKTKRFELEERRDIES